MNMETAAAPVSEHTDVTVTDKSTGEALPVKSGESETTPGSLLKKVLAEQMTLSVYFDIDPHLIQFLSSNTFFTTFSRNTIVYQSMSIPTAAVCYNIASDQLTMVINPAFFASLSHEEIQGVLRHEFYHIVFGHLVSRRKTPSRDWNIATDLAINSIIIETCHKTGGGTNSDGQALPKFALLPGQWPTKFDGTPMSAEEKAGAQLGALISQFPKMMASEWYFDKIQEAKREQGGDDKIEFGDGEGWIDSMDNHDAWDDLSEAQRELIENKIKDLVEKAVHSADAKSDGWGNIPAELREQIRKSVSRIVDWKVVLRQFIGHINPGGRTSSIKRINRRYPWIHPGTKRARKPRLLVARDESGSVSDEAIAIFFAELSQCARQTEIDLLPFDCSASEKDIVRWSKNHVPLAASIRTKCGGTDFNAPTQIYNDPRNRGRWDGLLILTDGQAGEPVPARGKRGWVLAPGDKLYFPSEELQIFVTPDRPMVGAWR